MEPAPAHGAGRSGGPDSGGARSHTIVVDVGGGIPDMQAYPHEWFETELRSHLLAPYPAETLRLERARLGSTAPLYGARALARA